MRRYGMTVAAVGVCAIGAVRADVITVPNAGFEAGISGWTASASDSSNTNYRYAAVTASTSGVPADAVTEGQSALMIWAYTNVLTLESGFSDARILGGSTYRLSLSYRHAATDGHLSVAVDWYDSSDTLLNTVKLVDTETVITPGRIHSNGDFGATDSVPGLVHSDLVAPAAATQFKIRIIAGQWITSAAPYYIDNITLSGNLAAIPEPASLGLVAAGAAMLLSRKRVR